MIRFNYIIKRGIFPFEIKNVENTSEEEILNMYTLLTY